MEGASTVFAERGYKGTNMSNSARKAGVSKGTLYNYFTSKADLFTAFVEECSRTKMPSLLASLQSDAPVQDTLLAIAGSMIRLMTLPDSLTLCRIIISEAPHFPHLAECFWQNGPRIAISGMAEWLRTQTDMGRLYVADPVFAAEQFFALCQTRVTHRKRFNLPMTEAEADEGKVITEAVRVFMAAYGPHTAQG